MSPFQMSPRTDFPRDKCPRGILVPKDKCPGGSNDPRTIVPSLYVPFLYVPRDTCPQIIPQRTGLPGRLGPEKITRPSSKLNTTLECDLKPFDSRLGYCRLGGSNPVALWSSVSIAGVNLEFSTLGVRNAYPLRLPRPRAFIISSSGPCGLLIGQIFWGLGSPGTYGKGTGVPWDKLKKDIWEREECVWDI
jgi:hypothetical protein